MEDNATIAPLVRLVEGWRQHFYSADRELQWLHVEQDATLELAPGVVLMGKLDAIGRTPDGDVFFGEWKTSGGRDKKTWKDIWRMNPQSLSYGLLARTLYPDCHRFTVRKAFKTAPPSYDHAWYSYTPGELKHWHDEVVRIAHEIQVYQAKAAVYTGPWPTNFNSCFTYGVNYACPFFASACAKQEWDGKPIDALVQVSPMRQQLIEKWGSHAILLSPSAISTWLSCRERFRREYIDNLRMPPTEALTLGGDFHAAMDSYYKELKERNIQ